MAEDYEKFIEWVEMSGFELNDYKRVMLKKTYEKNMAIIARQNGRNSAIKLLNEYNNWRGENDNENNH